MLTKVREEREDDYVVTEYTCDEVVQLAGNSIWGCNLQSVRVTDIVVHDDGKRKDVTVTHDGGEHSWTIYTDSGFKAAISALLGYAVRFTEQGMQDDELASMEEA